MSSSLEATDAASEAVRKGFRITLDDLRGRVADVEYLTRGALTVALLRLDNGYWLVGKSAPVDPGNYDAALGRQFAYDDALRQAWPLLAFAHLEAVEAADVEPAAASTTLGEHAVQQLRETPRRPS